MTDTLTASAVRDNKSASRFELAVVAASPLPIIDGPATA